MTMGSEAHLSAYGEDDYSYLEPDFRTCRAPQKANSNNNSNIVGKWILQEELGAGANSTVRKAFHCDTGVTAACKIMIKEGPESAVRKFVYREIEALKALDHPNIVRFYDHLEDSSKCYVFMELVEGKQIGDYLLEQGRLQENEARRLFRQIVSALEYCHANLVVHRDLKMENLLVDKHNNVKVTDFGFSNFIQPGNTFKTFCGSPNYAAPEILCSTAYLGPPVDIWSLGVNLYVMVTGQYPFSRAKFGQEEEFQTNEQFMRAFSSLKSRAVKGLFDIPPYLSLECASLLKKMIRTIPNKRITIAKLRKDPWVNKGYESYPNPFLPLVKRPVVHVRTEVLDTLESLGYERTKAKRALSSKDSHCSVTANTIAYTYYKILQKDSPQSEFRYFLKESIDKPQKSTSSSNLRMEVTNMSPIPIPAVKSASSDSNAIIRDRPLHLSAEGSTARPPSISSSPKKEESLSKWVSWLLR